MKPITDDHGRSAVAKLLGDFTFGYITAAILEGHMGAVLADDPHTPRLAALELRNELFGILILAGDKALPDAAELIRTISAETEVLFASPDWFEMAKRELGDRAIERIRYMLSGASLEVDDVQRRAQDVPEGYRLAPLDVDLARTLKTHCEWFDTGHGINFDSPEDFAERGFGFCLLEDDTIISAASTFAIADRGIEIQINTIESHRRQGLATIVAAALIAEALARGLDPIWDASSQGSADLATRLGYLPDREEKTLVVIE